ncbi:unnamed protein product [Urochloa humidicola]
MVGLSCLDFDPGLTFQRLVRDRFSCPVSFSPTPSSSEFWLVCSFGRSALRLNVDSVGLILQAVLGGIDRDFRVFHLSGWMFRFSVFSKDVGLMVYRLNKFLCQHFSIFFALWGNGGPNWVREYHRWCTEEDAKWVHVARSIRKALLKWFVLTRSNQNQCFLV